MPASETVFEYLAAAHEVTRGTAITAPTHYLNMSGTLKPTLERYRPQESRGILADFARSTVVRKGSTLEASGGLDVDMLPFLASMCLRGGVSPTTPDVGTAPTARLWTFAPLMTSEALKSATVWWGDPNNGVFRAPYMMLDEITLEADATGTDGATMAISGWGQPLTQPSAPALPAQTLGPLVTGLNMQLWLDTSSAIGTTEITARLASARAVLRSGLTPKYLAAGTSATLGFTKTGIKRRSAEIRVMLELTDMSQWTIFDQGTRVKGRLRFNGPLIAGAYYNYAEVDFYGPLDFDDWGEIEDSNRAISFTVTTEYDATAGYDYALKVQNTKTTI